jgi:hypothetical protein
MKTQDQRDPSSKTQQSHALAGKFISNHKQEEEEDADDMMKLNSSLHCHDSVIFAGEASAGFIGIHSTHVVCKSIAKLKQQTICLWMSPSSIFESAQRMVLPSASLQKRVQKL